MDTGSFFTIAVSSNSKEISFTQEVKMTKMENKSIFFKALILKSEHVFKDKVLI
jgi:hypothetical protein